MRTGVAIFGLILILIGMAGEIGVLPLDVPKFIISVLIIVGFIIFIIGLAIPKTMRKPDSIELSTDSQNMRSCSSCGKSITLDALRCPHCGRKFPIFQNPYRPLG